MLCATSYSQEITKKETLETEFGREYVLLIDGVEYRAITGPHAQNIVADRLQTSMTQRQLALCQTVETKLKQDVETQKQTIKIADLQVDIQKTEAEKWRLIAVNRQTIIDKQQALLGRRAWGSSFFENPWVDRSLKFGVSVLDTWWSKKAASNSNRMR